MDNKEQNPTYEISSLNVKNEQDQNTLSQNKETLKKIKESSDKTHNG